MTDNFKDRGNGEVKEKLLKKKKKKGAATFKNGGSNLLLEEDPSLERDKQAYTPHSPATRT